jgi:hypothetical protein
MPEQRLKDAMAEILPILKKHDCAAIVLLASEAHMEYLYEVCPSWACTKMEGEGQLRIRALRACYPSKEDHKKAVERTTGIFMGFLDLLKKAERDMQSVADLLSAQFEVTHWTKDETPGAAKEVVPARAIAEFIARDLFTDGQGKRANRLMMMHGGLDDERAGGGWSEKAVADRIESCLTTNHG